MFIWTNKKIEQFNQNEAANEKGHITIDIASAWLQNLGIHFACVLAACQHGQQLFVAFQRLETHFPDDGTIVNRIRCISITAVATILSTVGKSKKRWQEIV